MLPEGSQVFSPCSQRDPRCSHAPRRIQGVLPMLPGDPSCSLCTAEEKGPSRSSFRAHCSHLPCQGGKNLKTDPIPPHSMSRDTSTIPGCSWARSWDPRGAVNTLGAQLCLTHPLPCFFGQIPVVLGLQAGVAGSTGNCRQQQMPAVLWLPGHEAAEPGPGMSEG